MSYYINLLDFNKKLENIGKNCASVEVKAIVIVFVDFLIKMICVSFGF